MLAFASMAWKSMSGLGDGKANGGGNDSSRKMDSGV